MIEVVSTINYLIFDTANSMSSYFKEVTPYYTTVVIVKQSVPGIIIISNEIRRAPKVTA
jgi:hypothetical protein